MTRTLGKAVEMDPTAAARALREALQEEGVDCAFVARFTETVSRILHSSEDEPLPEIDKEGFELVAFKPGSRIATPASKKEAGSHEARTALQPSHIKKLSNKRRKKQSNNRSDKRLKKESAINPKSSGHQAALLQVDEIDEVSEGEEEISSESGDDDDDDVVPGEDLAGVDFDAADGELDAADNDSDSDQGNGSEEEVLASPTLSISKARSSNRRKISSLKARTETLAVNSTCTPTTAALQVQALPVSDLRDSLTEGNIEPCWHKAIILLHDILAVSPLDPQRIVDEALSLLRPLQKDRLAALPVPSAQADLSASIDRLEEAYSLRKSLAIYSIIEHLHLFSLDRQAKVDVKLGGPLDAIQKLDRAKLRIQVKAGGFLMQNAEDWRLNGRSIGPAQHHSSRPALLSPNSAQQNSRSNTAPQGPLTSEERLRLKTINSYLRNPLRAGRLLHELGCTMGSVTFVPLLMLSKSMEDPVTKVRHFNAMEWHALTLLLRGARPQVAHGHGKFTAADQQIIDAIVFGVRGVLSRVCNHALLVADALAEENKGNYANVLVVRPSRSAPKLGDEEPSVSASPSETSSPQKQTRVYGLEIPGSDGGIEVITRRPAFISDKWREFLQRSGPEESGPATIEEAFVFSGAANMPAETPSPNTSDHADRRTLQLARCDPDDVLPFASAYTAHFRLSKSSEAFHNLCDAIKRRAPLLDSASPSATVKYLQTLSSSSFLPSLTSPSSTHSDSPLPLATPHPGSSSSPKGR
ncbi:hypothetical protein OC844_003990 [Tilletia horrida]|nr:hypothetical protein OC844_003990 [Tilletia horrida]